MEIFAPYQEPDEEEYEWSAGEESPTTGTQYGVAESQCMENVAEDLHDDNEDVWSRQQHPDELMEMMKQTAEERDAYRDELEVLRDNCIALEEERSQLLSKVGATLPLHSSLRSTLYGRKKKQLMTIYPVKSNDELKA